MYWLIAGISDSDIVWRSSNFQPQIYHQELRAALLPENASWLSQGQAAARDRESGEIFTVSAVPGTITDSSQISIRTEIWSRSLERTVAAVDRAVVDAGWYDGQRREKQEAAVIIRQFFASFSPHHVGVKRLKDGLPAAMAADQASSRRQTVRAGGLYLGDEALQDRRKKASMLRHMLIGPLQSCHTALQNLSLQSAATAKTKRNSILTAKRMRHNPSPTIELDGSRSPASPSDLELISAVQTRTEALQRIDTPGSQQHAQALRELRKLLSRGIAPDILLAVVQGPDQCARVVNVLWSCFRRHSLARRAGPGRSPQVSCSLSRLACDADWGDHLPRASLTAEVAGLCLVEPCQCPASASKPQGKLCIQQRPVPQCRSEMFELLQGSGCSRVPAGGCLVFDKYGSSSGRG